VAAQVGELQVADVVPVDEDPSAADVVEARHEVGERGLAAARVTDEGDGATGGHLEAHILEDAPVAVREAHPVERHGAGRLRQRRRVRSFLHLDGRVEQLVDALPAGHRALCEAGEPADHLRRVHEHHEVRVEGDKLAQGETPLDDLAPAVPEEEGDREVGQEGDQRDVDGARAGGGDAGLEHARAAVAELRHLVVLAGEDAHDARPDDVLLGRRRDVGDALLDVPEDRPQPAAEAPGHEEEGRKKRERQQGETPVERQQDDGDGEDHDDVDGEEDHAVPEEHAHVGDVAHQPGHQLAGGPAVEVGERLT